MNIYRARRVFDVTGSTGTDRSDYFVLESDHDQAIQIKDAIIAKLEAENKVLYKNLNEAETHISEELFPRVKSRVVKVLIDYELTNLKATEGR